MLKIKNYYVLTKDVFERIHYMPSIKKKCP